MDFNHSARALEWQDRVRHFLDAEVVPNEALYFAQVREDSTRQPPVMEAMKAKAREAGLWNMFLPGDHGAGLTNLEYAPLAEMMGYMRRKLDLSRNFPRESRLFANEVLQGAPRIGEVIQGELHDLVQEKARLLSRWMDQGRIRRSDPVHLIISVWALTQHYADFETQTRSVLGPDRDPWTGAAGFLETLYLRLLAPPAG